MKFFHTADWHLGKLVQGVYMTEDQQFILDQFVEAVKEEKPDVVIIAGDLYDRAVPPTDAIDLLNEVFEKIVLTLNIPILAIGGNHDSPGRLHFGSNIMKSNGLHIVGQFSKEQEPVILEDEHGEVHVHLVPYCDPSTIRTEFNDNDIRSHNDAAEKIINHIESKMDPHARHIFVGHSFVTPYGEEQANTSESERPLSIGGAEYINAEHFTRFDYTALGHLHQAHRVQAENIRYAGSILKYSISEEHHKKGYYIVEMDGEGDTSIMKHDFTPRREMRTVEAAMDDILRQPVSDDYVFVRLTDEAPILFPMEKIRSVFPNAMHVERINVLQSTQIRDTPDDNKENSSQMSDLDLFKAFYKEVKGDELSQEAMTIFEAVLDELLQDEREDVHEEKTPEQVPTP